MPDQLFVRPAAGLKVADPDRRDHLPEDGRPVPDTAYWRRRIDDGDVELVKDPPSSS